MRTRVYGWVVLGLAVSALPWDWAHQPRHADGKPGAAPPVGLAPRPRASPPTPDGMAAAMPDAEFAAGASAPAARREPDAVPAQGEPGHGTQRDAARRAATSLAVPVREFPPGSKAHAQAIAAHVASDEIQDVLSPLARLYLGYFGRVPDYEGFAYYIGERDRGEPLESIADEFAQSAEFEARYGALDAAAFVDRVLQNVRGAPVGAQQRAYWIGELESGRMTRGQVMLAFSESTGYRAMTSNEVFVAIAYAETLGRAPDPVDLARWVRFLDAGNPRRAVIDVLLAERGKG